MFLLVGYQQNTVIFDLVFCVISVSTCGWMEKRTNNWVLEKPCTSKSLFGIYQVEKTFLLLPQYEEDGFCLEKKEMIHRRNDNS